MPSVHVIEHPIAHPVVRSVRIESRPERRRGGALRGRIWIADDFDEIPEEFGPYLIGSEDGEGPR